MAPPLASLGYILLMLLGFGLIIVVHELGHFLAARWAGIRVHAFAVGFGPALLSYRKGMGVRAGSSERDYTEMLERERTGLQPDRDPSRVSPTEYRLNAVPLGGYVRMLGQEDANPEAVSHAPDSFTSKPVWKRMVVVSAGVVMNVALAAALFILVFLVGLREVAPAIGAVGAGSPAERAGLRAGDVVRTINGRSALTFNDLALAAAFAGPDASIELEVQRAGEGTRTISVVPELDEAWAPAGLPVKTIGVAGASSATLVGAGPGAPAAALREQFARVGLDGAEPGMRLVSVDGEAVEATSIRGGEGVALLAPLREAARTSGGRAIATVFEGPDGRRVPIDVAPWPELQSARADLGGSSFEFVHVAGLVGPVRVTQVQPRAAAQGLEVGDVFARVGDRAWPSTVGVIREVKASAGREIDLELIRGGERVPMTARVAGDGTIGFFFESAMDLPVLARTPEPEGAGASAGLAGRRVIPAIPPGSRLVSVDGEAVSSLREARTALQRATAPAHAAGAAAEVTLGVEIDAASGVAPASFAMAMTADEVSELHGLGWALGPVAEQFAVAEYTLRAGGVVEALVMGVQQTHRMMMRAYLTLQRIVQGTVSPRLINGPVGITYFGSKYAEKGFTYYLFFLALISVNLAVVNFLPFPIIDGGLFLMLVYEGIVKRPVPIVVQNAATLVGLAGIALVFVYVTINDLKLIFF
jgi:regulator of sigma E protease